MKKKLFLTLLPLAIVVIAFLIYDGSLVVYGNWYDPYESRSTMITVEHIETYKRIGDDGEVLHVSRWISAYLCLPEDGERFVKVGETYKFKTQHGSAYDGVVAIKKLAFWESKKNAIVTEPFVPVLAEE